MVGGTRFHRWIHEASLGRNAGQRKDSFREEGKKRALAARRVQVSLDRADAIIEGGANRMSWILRTSCTRRRLPFSSSPKKHRDGGAPPSGLEGGSWVSCFAHLFLHP